MSWIKTFQFDPRAALADAVRWRRMLGSKQEHALTDAAGALDLTPRKARSLFRGEPAKIAPSAYETMMRRWFADLDLQVAALRAQANEIERRAGHLRTAADPSTASGSVQCSDTTSLPVGGAR